MERQGLVEGITTGEKRIYKLSKKGEEMVRSFLRNRGSIQLLMESLLCK
jgi:DNA-binding PadR family transcriptional regulator